MVVLAVTAPDAEAASETQASPGTLRAHVAAHPVLSVVLLTYALTWVVLVPIALESHGWLPFSVPGVAVLAAAWGPLIAAVGMTGVIGGRRAVRAFIGRLLIWRVHPAWYLVVLLGPAVYILVGVAIARATGLSDAALPVAPYAFSQVAISFVLTLLLAVFINTEEFAWRGVALPLLQGRHNALVASLILGAIHTAWHLPYFLTIGRPFYEQIGFPMFAAWTIALTILLTWIYNSTRGSLLLPVLFHAALFAWQQLLSPADAMPFFISIGLLWIAVVAVVLVYGARDLARAPRTVTFGSK